MEADKDLNLDNRVDPVYVASRLINILETDNKHIRAELEGFKQEIFHNIGANIVHDHNN